MRICMLTPQLPYPPEQGAAMRNYHLLRHAARHHTVTLVAYGEATQPVPEALSSLCDQVILRQPLPRSYARRLAEQIRPAPDLALRLRSRAAPRQLEPPGGSTTWDVVQVEGLEMMPLARQFPAHRLLLDEHNAEYVLQQSASRADVARGRLLPALYSLVQTAKLIRYEGSACAEADVVTAVSVNDAQALRHLTPSARIEVVPNGVDTARYQPDVSAEGNTAGPPTLIFAGKMDFRPNVDATLWLAYHVLPRIWLRRPDVRFTIFGMLPPVQLQVLARDPRIDVTGYVPGFDAERRYLARARAVVVPLQSGGGTRLKVLTAMACGKAIVSTPTGCAGLDIRDGQHVLLAQSAGRFAEQVLHLLEDNDLRQRLGRAARQLAVDRYDWSAITRTMERFYT